MAARCLEEPQQRILTVSLLWSWSVVSCVVSRAKVRESLSSLTIITPFLVLHISDQFIFLTRGTRFFTLTNNVGISIKRFLYVKNLFILIPTYNSSVKNRVTRDKKIN